MSRVLFSLALLSIATLAWSSPPGVVPTEDPTAGARILAMIPAQRLAEIPASVIEAVLRGDFPAERFAASLGLAQPVRAMGAPSELQAKQFITHWLDHYTCLGAGVDEDYVGEASIDGRCSGQTMTDNSSAPTLHPTYYANASGALITAYWQVPTDPATGASRTTNLSRYAVTWVKSLATRNAKVWLGASDYFRLWINGSPVMSRTAGGSKPFAVDEYKADVTLVAGWNLIVVKQSFPQLGPASDPNEDHKYKLFSLRFVSDNSGTPITDLVAAFDPNCTEADRSVDTRVWVPNVAHIPGYSSHWRTDVLLFNGTHMKWSHRVRFYREGNNSGTPDAEKYLEMAPYQALTFPDALQTLFGVTANTKGYMAVLQQDYYRYYSQAVHLNGWLQAKTFNLTKSGTFGTLNPMLYQYDGTLSAVTFFGLRNGAYRSNLAIFPGVNTGATAKIRLTLFGPGIAIPLVKEYPEIHGFWQLNNLFQDLGAESVNTDSAVLHLEVLENPTETYWFPYATILDGNEGFGTPGTSDPVYLPPGYLPLLPPSLH